MKKFLGAVLFLAAILFANTAKAAVVDYSIVPDKAGIILISGNLTDLMNGFGSIMKVDSDGESQEKFERLLSMLNTDRAALGGFYTEDITSADVLTNMDDDDLGDQFEQRVYFVVPLKASFDDFVALIGESDEVVELSQGIYQADEIFMTKLTTGAGDYVLAAGATNVIDWYLKSAKFNPNSPSASKSLTKFLNENRNRTLAFYISENATAKWNDIGREMFNESSEVQQFSSVMEMFNQYGLNDMTSYSEGYLDSFSLPVQVVVRSYLKSGASLRRVFNAQRSYGAGFLDQGVLAYAEVDLQPAFIKDVLTQLGVLEGGLTAEQFDQMIQTINGTFSAALYSDTIQNGDMNTPPDFIGFAGLNRRDYAELLLAMMVEYEKITISGQQVLEILTSNSTYPEIYIFIDKKDIVVSSSEDLMTMYIKNMLRNNRPFASNLVMPSGYYQPFSFLLPPSPMVQMMTAAMRVPGMSALKKIDMKLFIADDGSVMEYRLRIE